MKKLWSRKLTKERATNIKVRVLVDECIRGYPDSCSREESIIDDDRGDTKRYLLYKPFQWQSASSGKLLREGIT